MMQASDGPVPSHSVLQVRGRAERSDTNPNPIQPIPFFPHTMTSDTVTDCKILVSRPVF